ncbi:sorbosone dehydrogenase [Massilia sp. WF1]|uniref:PQQ-dependent sugar dehydrogenase n=1 Tax=unclassified Massilia TaxID=2609279 RepID=UPI00064AA45A|nr:MULTISPECIES: sorbosone dehydrogenase family protein [unclassified Massilia]ALK99083.1 sorbosone dehydrogenase [Massilia sp. WG5]KLU36043.1 sorbosone dehydrogenase [Massilia sp. WF1]
MSRRGLPIVLLVAASLSACAGPGLSQQALSQQAATGYLPGFGPNPALPAPEHSLIPTLNIAPAEPWPQGTHPTPAAGLAATAYASGLEHPRWLYVLPNGDVLVAESNKPVNAPKEKGIRAKVQGIEQKRAGAGVESPNKIVLLRGVKADGTAEMKTLFAQDLNSPFGMALVGNALYIANADALWRFPYKTGDTALGGQGTKVLDLPAGINHHWTKNVVASPDGKKLYITVGSNSNAAENGMDIEQGRAAIWEYDIASGGHRIYASGLRNPNGLDFQPQTKALWTAVNERDELGNDLVPDYMTAVKDGAFYGWPYSYYGQHVDTRVEPQKPALVATAIPPDYALGAHTASLGLAFYDARLLPQFRNGALIGQHGSWNRKPHSGYKLVYVPFTDGKPSGPPQDVLTGFLSRDGKAYGRPVGVAVDRQGAILLADDVGNIVWRITPAAK